MTTVPNTRAPVPVELVEHVMAASRVLVAVSVQSMRDIDSSLTPIQVRTLMMLASRGAMRPTELAHALGVHPSNATRACDKLVAVALLDRRENPQNRRSSILGLTLAGRQLITSIARRRARGIMAILRCIAPDRRTAVAEAMSEFAAAGGEHLDSDLWAMGWIT